MIKSQKTKGLIKKREELRNKPILTELEKIELTEIRKLVRREIKTTVEYLRNKKRKK